MASLEKQVERIVAATIAAGQTPGAVVLVGRGHDVVLHEAYGQRMTQPEARPMLLDTVFDMASVTKPVATATAVMQLVEQGDVNLSQPISHWFPGFAPAITVRHLMTHSSGLKPYRNYLHEWGDTVPPGQRRRKVVADIARLPLDYVTGQGFAYSCLNYVVLASLVRRVSGLPLDVYFRRRIAGPLGLLDSRFHTGAMPFDAAQGLRNRAATRCAATEPLPGGVLCGVVHDEIARYLGGVGGNAGLFSTAADLSRFMRMILHGGELDGVRLLQKKTIRTMTSPGLTLARLQRGLGWDINSTYSPSVRGRFPAGSFGHTGFTGTSVWADPVSRVYLIILSNRVHFGREVSVMGLRQKLADLVAKELLT
ncbi:MAG: beta-lactamase family protein [Armatimonadetes bacterium]|nr:beta-lactamase family protein [Armatimonadota bacterium]